MSKSVLYMPVAMALNYAGMVAIAVAVNLVPVFLTTFSVDLGGPAGLTNEQFGRISAAIFFGLVGGMLVAGPMADRWGAKPFAVIGNLGVSAGLALLAWSPSYSAVLGAAFLMGAGAGVLDMVLSPIVCALQPHRKNAAMNWLHSFYCTGAVATVLAASMALSHGVSWRVMSLALVALPAVVALGFALMPLPPLVADGRRRTRLRDLIHLRFFQVILVAIFLGGATEMGMAQWLPAYAEKALGYTKWVGGMALLWFSVAAASLKKKAGMLGGRVDPVRLMFHLCWLSVILFLAGCFSPWPAVALVACVLAGLTGSCLWPSILGVTADEYPQGGATMFAILSAMGNFGGIFMPWIVGVTADVGKAAETTIAPMRWGLSTATLCPLLLAIILVWIGRHRTKRHAGGRHEVALEAAK